MLGSGIRWALVYLACLPFALAALGGGAAAAADEPVRGAKIISPSSFGMDIPEGEVSWPPDMRVRVHAPGEVPFVGRVHVKIGNYLVVLRPDGELKHYPLGQTQVVDEPFEALTAEEAALRLASGPFRGFRVKHTRRHAFVYNTSEPFAEATRRIIESMYRGVLQHLRNHGVPVEEPEVPMVVIMFATEAQFQRYEPMPPGVVAYYDMMTNQVVLHSEFDALAGSREIALALAYSTIAHEGAHQILHNVGVQQRLSLWPMWLGEGLAEYYAPTDVGRQFRWKGAGLVNDMRMFELELYLQVRAFKQIDGEVLHETISAARLESTGYASAWALTHFLSRRYRQQFFDYIRLLSGLRPMEGLIADPGDYFVHEGLEHFHEHFTDSLVETESQLIAYLNGLTYTSPVAHMPHIVATVTWADQGTPQRRSGVFHSQSLAQHWVGDLMQALPEELRRGAQVELWQAPNRQAAHRLLSRGPRR